jgi:NDP-sugar pyrophosphorylase family protein
MKALGNLLILGAGQFGRMTQEIAESVGAFGKIDFLDDVSELAVGKLGDYERFVGEYPSAVVAVGAAVFRAEWLTRLESAGFVLPPIVSPDAYVAPSARLEGGVIVEPSATIQSRVSVGRGTIVSSGAVLRHDAAVGECCHCDCNSVVASGAAVPNATKVEIGEIFRG